MNRKPYIFTANRYKSHLKISVSEEAVNITKVQSGGFGLLRRADDAYKAEIIGRVAELGDIWNLRIRGYTEIAEIAFKAYRKKHS